MKSFKQFIREERDDEDIESSIEDLMKERYVNDPDWAYDRWRDIQQMEAEMAEKEKQPPAGKLDPLGKETPDVNNDGKLDSGDAAILARRNAIEKAIKERK
jgi:hypothetical protein